MSRRAFELRPGDVLESGKVVDHITDRLVYVTVYFTDGTATDTVYCYMFYLQKRKSDLLS
jgi:hypothetical protein